MSRSADLAFAAVAKLLDHQPPSNRSAFLRELLAHTAAGLVVLEGREKAAEAIYRLADAVVGGNKK